MRKKEEFEWLKKDYLEKTALHQQAVVDFKYEDLTKPFVKINLARLRADAVSSYLKLICFMNEARVNQPVAN